VLLDDGDLEVSVDTRHDLNELFELLSVRGVRISSLRNKANRLEELFMGLVEGKHAAVAADPVAGRLAGP